MESGSATRGRASNKAEPHLAPLDLRPQCMYDALPYPRLDLISMSMQACMRLCDTSIPDLAKRRELENELFMQVAPKAFLPNTDWSLWWWHDHPEPTLAVLSQILFLIWLFLSDRKQASCKCCCEEETLQSYGLPSTDVSADPVLDMSRATIKDESNLGIHQNHLEPIQQSQFQAYLMDGLRFRRNKDLLQDVNFVN